LTFNLVSPTSCGILGSPRPTYVLVFNALDEIMSLVIDQTLFKSKVRVTLAFDSATPKYPCYQYILIKRSKIGIGHICTKDIISVKQSKTICPGVPNFQ